MNVLVDIGHPAHVHFFRHAVAELRDRGHDVRLAARELPVALELLRAYGLSCRVVGAKRRGALGLALELACHGAGLLAMTLSWRPDVATAIGGTLMVGPARLRRCRVVVWDDTDTAVMENRITHPLAHRIMTPDVYPMALGPRQTRYHGLHELAYLHPKRFRPNPATLTRYGLSPDTPYAVVRLGAFEAGHDLAVRRHPPEALAAVIRELAERGEVVLVPEGDVPAVLTGYVKRPRPEDFHDLLAFATFCLTEGATTASEAAILGTPALYVNPIVTCYIRDMADRGLLTVAVPGQDLFAAFAAASARSVPEARRKATDIFDAYEDVSALIVDVLEGRR
ncbi:protein of unknown function DUF354 [Solidesulfovibrio fructosivorans JJ]]|uniref:DUF354 domain-containing protein n=1 Tax=Solidesulfovibrio fructosivorans JJ] TaxID=596151 RepID=E1JXW2_SOLFR|nr:DUF354 domain-containing protein [Solidesulfovibrio fructosivorans]EFL50885.1 protein of unknown function DUF354 [Solidesulfovibrio fructosivorans JJ]]